MLFKVECCCLQAVHEDIVSHQQRILSLVFQAEQLTENYQEELTPEQVTQIQSLATGLKSNLDKVNTSWNSLFLFVEVFATVLVYWFF